MNKIMVLGLMFVCLSGYVTAIPQLQLQVDQELKFLSKTFEQETVKETVEFGWNYFNNNINHVFYWYPRSYALSWYQKEGDCTDKAILLNQTMNYLNISIRFKHGFVKNGFGWVDGGHDWIEYYDGEEWYNYEYEKSYWTKMLVIGEGIF